VFALLLVGFQGIIVAAVWHLAIPEPWNFLTDKDLG
jgi:hypothetical protein